MPKHIVIGQKVAPVKRQRAKELRGSLTQAEKILWQSLRTNKLDGFHFRRQQIIDGFIVDFYCDEASLVIELDGGIHDQQVEYDAERDAVLSARDLKVLRFKNEEIEQNLPQVLNQIREACRQNP